MALEAGVAAAVLFAGALHAVWNALVKSGRDRTATMALVIASSAIPWLPLVFILPAPAPESWPFLVASTVIHVFYFAFLINGYRYGDLSQIYPIARGMAPALVAAGAWAWASEALAPMEGAGVLLVCLGIVSLAWRRAGFAGDNRALLFALLTGLSIAAYIVVDGLGVRQAGMAISYIAWLFVLQGTVMALIGAWLRRERLRATFEGNWIGGLVGGCLASVSYGVAIWAMSVGSLAHIAVLRETSVLVAAVIGTRLLGEPFGRQRVIAAAVVACGAVLVQFGG